MSFVSLSPTPRAAAPRGELRPDGRVNLAMRLVQMLIRLLLGLLGRAEAPEENMPAATAKLIREAARAVAIPAWALEPPRDYHNSALTTILVEAREFCLIHGIATRTAAGGGGARPAAPARRREPPRTGLVRAPRTRRPPASGGPPPRAGPAGAIERSGGLDRAGFAAGARGR